MRAAAVEEHFKNDINTQDPERKRKIVSENKREIRMGWRKLAKPKQKLDNAEKVTV